MRGGTEEVGWFGDESTGGEADDGGGGGVDGLEGREGEMAGVCPGRGFGAVVKGGYLFASGDHHFWKEF